MEYSEKVCEIISKEKKVLDAIANEYIKGNEKEAQRHIYGLFLTYGYVRDCDDTNQLLDYVGAVIGLYQKQKESVWKTIEQYPNYEITVEGDIRRIGSTAILKEENGRVKIRHNRKTITVKALDLVWDTWYKNNEENIDDMKDEYVEMTSEVYDSPFLDDVANDMNFTGNLIMSSKTETDEERRID